MSNKFSKDKIEILFIVLAIILFLLFNSPCASALKNSPASCNGWINCTDAFGNDLKRATANATASINTSGTWSNYGFSIPSNSFIKSVKIRADFFASASSGFIDIKVSNDAGLTYGNSHIIGGNTAEQSFFVDATNDSGWTASKLSNANFRVNITCFKSDSGSNVTCSLDLVQVQVNYTLFDFSVSVNPSSASITQGGSTQTAVTVTLLENASPNAAPVLKSIGPQIATEGSLFTLDVDATDPDNDDLEFRAYTSLFTINPANGLINFTPSLSQVGNYTINISVFDGQLYGYEVISFRIVRGVFCGDNSCGSTESCSSCPLDCGDCPQPSSAGEGGGGGGGEGEAGFAGASSSSLAQGVAPFYRCDEKWECSDWSVCSLEDTKTRKCIEINKCNTRQKKPAEIEHCEYQPTCNDGIKNGNEEGIDCGGICQPCIVPNCFDGIKNQNEEDIDCGGLCKPCEIKKFARIPFIELPSFKISKQFPWLFVLFISISIALTVAGDQIYVRRIAKKDFEEYKKSIRKYRLLRRRIYKSVVNVAIITIIVSLYIFLFSDNFENMKKYAWIPITIFLLAPAAVSAFIRHYTYYEYKKRRKGESLNQTHEREILQLIALENKLLMDSEAKLKNKLYALATQHKFDNYPALYNEINSIFGILSSLEKSRKEKAELAKIDAGIFKRISDFIENEALIKISKDYPEFMSILKILEYIHDNINLSTYDGEQEFLDEIREISKPHMASVIKSNSRLIALYNEFVDVYGYFIDKHADLSNKDKAISKTEREFIDKIKEITKKASILEVVQKNADFASMYNSLVDLFNHYTNKQELSKSIK